MDPEQRIAMDQVRSRFPSLSVSEVRSLLEAHHWRVSSACDAAAKAAEAATKSGGPASYFVGGGDHGSGQHVLARPEDHPAATDVVNSIFQQAKAQGATEDESSPQAFFGKARRLGHTTTASPFVASTVRQRCSITVTLYRNGIRVGDGPLTALESSEGREILLAMEKGYIPPSLVSQYPDCDLDVILHDCLNMDYEAPAYSAFQGTGHRMSAAVSASPSSSGQPESYTPSRTFSFHEDEPSSFICILNSNGERKEFQVNPSRHTVEDVYFLAHTFQPELKTFVLVVRGFPPRKLLDHTRQQTIAEAKLQRAVISIQSTQGE